LRLRSLQLDAVADYQAGARPCTGRSGSPTRWPRAASRIASAWFQARDAGATCAAVVDELAGARAEIFRQRLSNGDRK
jgi:hypothetical protein